MNRISRRIRSLAALAGMAALLSGCSGTGSGGAASIEVDPLTIDFGKIAPASAVERTINVLNKGQGQLVVSTVAINGDGAAHFFAIQQSLNVEAGATGRLTVTYRPSAEGTHSARLLLSSNAANSPELAVPLFGQAVAGNPCAGMTCNTPPGPCYQDVGTCSGGTCSYQPKAAGTACDDGDACTTGDVCHAGTCAGTPKTCNTPPAGTCAGANSFTAYNSPGTCSAGTCQYASHVVTCSAGCANDVCHGDPCAGISCNTPPANSCFDATTKVTYSAQGSCSQGSCNYSPTQVPCAASEVCLTGSCKWDDASLSSLSISPGALVFSASQTVYAVSVPAGTTSVSLTAAVAQPTRATIHINGNLATSGTAVSVSLGSSPTSIAVKVDAESGSTKTYTVAVTLAPAAPSQQAYVKASNTDTSDAFGTVVALSSDGNTMAIGAPNESSSDVGINGIQSDNSAAASGAVYLFVRSGGNWTQQAYLKASNAEANDKFGTSLALSSDGNTLAVGAPGEDSTATGVGGNQSNTGYGTDSGAAYVFTRTGTSWAQQAYVKASNTDPNDAFGTSVALSGDGNLLAVGAPLESSAATGINGSQTQDPNSLWVGAVYLFGRSGTTWAQQVYVKASNSHGGDKFGTAVALSADGSTLAVGAPAESCTSSGINSNQNARDYGWEYGAAYVFAKTGNTWAQQAYVKPSNMGSGDNFGNSMALSADGSTLAVASWREDSNATGINGDQANDSALWSGAAYVFTRSGTSWTQQAYVKASNTEADDSFGIGLSLSADGNTLAVGANAEDSNATGIDGNQADNSATSSGAVYLLTRTGTAWAHKSYLKASNTRANTEFGKNAALSGDGHTLAVGSPGERSSATGTNGTQNDISATGSGAVYVFTR